LIVNPGIHVSTPAAYKDLKVRKKKPPILNRVSKFDPNDSRVMINDFEKVIFSKFPEIEKIKYEMLSLGAEFSLMSGSGSTIYGIFPSGKLNKAEKYFRNKNYKVFAA
jgi:4-diphosphocytidyl-2-C-methyl-D-erythritol kinase